MFLNTRLVNHLRVLDETMSEKKQDCYFLVCADKTSRITYSLLSKAEETPHIFFSRLTKPSSSGCKVKTQILFCCMYQSEHECDYLRHCLFKQTCKSVYKIVCWFDRMWYGVIVLVMWYGVIVLVMWYGVIVLVMRNRVFVRLVKLLIFDHFCLLT